MRQGNFIMPAHQVSTSYSIKDVNSSSSSDRSSSAQNNEQSSEKGKMHKRSRSGCFTCRLRRKKCDEGQPTCKACQHLSVKCEYKRPMWWGSPEQRRLQKERIKNKIKRTKSLERNRASHSGNARRTLVVSPSPPVEDYMQPIPGEWQTTYGLHHSQNGYVPWTYSYPDTSAFDVQVKTELQTYVNDIAVQHTTSTSKYNTMSRQIDSALPPYPEQQIFSRECIDPRQDFDFSVDELGEYDEAVHQQQVSLTANIPIDDIDRPLLDHFLNNVLGMIFPILDIHPHRCNDGHQQHIFERADNVLQSMENNRSYLHCCLTVAAIHLKTTEGMTTGWALEQINQDILRHRWGAVSELAQAFNRNDSSQHILDAALAMIFFNCCVGEPDDSLPDVSWDAHFQAVVGQVSALELSEKMILKEGEAVPEVPFSMSLVSWIDILGSTMLGTAPKFAHCYRNKHLSGTSSGLRKLMGCDDRVMYLISEICCLESLKNDGSIEDSVVLEHVTSLGVQLEHVEIDIPKPSSPYAHDGTILPKVVTDSITGVFILAARIYLLGLLPGAKQDQLSISRLVDSVVVLLNMMPNGIYAYDRSLVWPLFITGIFSLRGSLFRQELDDRVDQMGSLANFGNWGRMWSLLNEYWRLTDEPEGFTPTYDNLLMPPPSFPVTQQPFQGSQLPNYIQSQGIREIRRRPVHWREIMEERNLKYLLI